MWWNNSKDIKKYSLASDSRHYLQINMQEMQNDKYNMKQIHHICQEPKWPNDSGGNKDTALTGWHDNEIFVSKP